MKSEYVKSKDYKGSFGHFGYQIFICEEGRKSIGAPELRIQIGLLDE